MSRAALLLAALLSCRGESTEATAVPKEKVAPVTTARPIRPNAQLRVDRHRLVALGVTVSELVAALRAAGVQVVTTDDAGVDELRIGVVTVALEAEKLGSLFVTARKDVPVRVNDLASIVAMPDGL